MTPVADGPPGDATPTHNAAEQDRKAAPTPATVDHSPISAGTPMN